MSPSNNANKFYSFAQGKLLLTGEYFVLDGAKALACPTQMGQDLSIETLPSENPLLKWSSFDHVNKIWFQTTIRLPDLKVLETNDSEISNSLVQILKQLTLLNSNIIKSSTSIKVETRLDFKREFGLGTSSTLVYNLATWAKVSPFDLLAKTFGGSAYDIACAQEDAPISYQLVRGKPQWRKENFEPPFIDNLYFLYLGKKQNSREGIKLYRKKAKTLSNTIDRISNLTDEFIKTNSLSEFNELIIEHENIVSETIKLPKVKDVIFNDFNGQVKSLGAWGGDFVLLTHQGKPEDLLTYTKSKKMHQLFPFKKIILS